MRTIEKTIYKFTELSDEAKDTARTNWGANGWDRDDEYMDSIKALAEHFDGKVKNWSIDWTNSTGPSEMDFDMPNMPGREILRRLRALGTFNRRTLKGHGDCKLTGVCYDENAIDGFRWAWYRDGYRSLDELMQAAFDSWVKAAWEDYHYDVWGDGFAETCEANDYEFDENGRMI